MQKYVVVGQISPDATRFMRAGEVDMYVCEEADAVIAEHQSLANMQDINLKQKDAEIARLKELLRRVTEWTPAFPVEASLLDEISEALKL